jgi:uncharacterized membrane protein YphA (DoxX/SURF4 family)
MMAAGMLGVAVCCLWNRDSAFQWQPVPASWPLRLPLIDFNALILAVAAICLLQRQRVRTGATALLVVMAAWIVGLHMPRVVAGREAAWAALFECVAVAAGAALAMGSARRVPPASGFDPTARWAIVAFAASLLAFGIAHFIYLDFTAAMVPRWIPAQRFWACFTGIAHISAGIGLVTGVLQRWAAALLAAMFCAFAVLVNLPQALGAGDLGPATIGLCFAMALSGSALLVADVVLSSAPDRSFAGSPARLRRDP